MGDRLPLESKNILIDTALEEAERLNQFITNILNMTRLESGEIQFDQTWVNPTKIVGEVTHRLRHHLANHDIHVEIDDRVAIHTDPTMMTQVIQNMVDNAIKYSPAGSQITIIGKMADDGYQIMIIDEGPGIDDDQRQAVFDKYERLQHTDSNKAGTGLGLAICRAIMEAQGGQADVLTRQDLQTHPDDRLKGHDGAVFILTFPDVDLKSKNKEKWTRQPKKQTEKQS
jgi:two-component system sensor histidine kinase KdpD